MRVFNFTEQPYPDAWNLGFDSLRVNLLNRLDLPTPESPMRTTAAC